VEKDQRRVKSLTGVKLENDTNDENIYIYEENVDDLKIGILDW
jgi:hypothetical protein